MADGLCYHALSGLLWVDAESNLLCVHEVWHLIDHWQFNNFMSLFFHFSTEKHRPRSKTTIAVIVTLPAPDLHREYTTMTSFLRHTKIKFTRWGSMIRLHFYFRLFIVHKFVPWNFELSGDSGVSRIISSILFLRFFLTGKIFVRKLFLFSRFCLALSLSDASLKSVGKGGFSLNCSKSSYASYGRFCSSGAKFKMFYKT